MICRVAGGDCQLTLKKKHILRGCVLIELMVPPVDSRGFLRFAAAIAG